VILTLCALQASNDKAADGSDLVLQDTQNETAALLYLSMDRFANMLAVGRKGLVYSISREVLHTHTRARTHTHTHLPPPPASPARCCLPVWAAPCVHESAAHISLIGFRV